MCVRSFGVSLDIGYWYLASVVFWTEGEGVVDGLMDPYIATLILTVICAETISVDTFITPEESKRNRWVSILRIKYTWQKGKVALDSLSSAKSFLLRLLTTICFKNYSIIFIDISVQLRRLKHSQFAQNREI